MALDLDTVIESVTVYPERALVTRRGAATLETAGEHTLRISGLPQTVLRDSLRATGTGPAGTRILGIEQVAEIHPAPPEEDARRLRDEIARLRREIALIGERQGIIEQQRDWLRALGLQSARLAARGIFGESARPEDAGAAFTYAAGESERLAAAKLELETRREELQREQAARERELAELGNRQRPDRIAAEVRIEMPAGGRVEVRLAYLVYGASWQPRYDARVDTTAFTVRLTQQALVSQRTGEDWTGVALALSTAQPAAAVTLPDEPDPWYVDVVHPAAPPPAMGAVMARRAMRAPMAASSASDGEVHAYRAYDTIDVEEEMAVAGAEVERSGVAQVYRLPGGTDVPSDGQPHTLGTGEDDLPCRFEYAAMPSVAPGAHLRALAANTTGRVLLPGALHVFHAGAEGDEYVGATRLDLTAENADLKLYLGVDDNVTVKRELVERDTDRGSLLQAGIRRITIGYRVTLGNRTSSPQRVILKDRLPVPRNEKVKLKVLDIRPQPTERTRLDQLTWETQLAPNEVRRVEWRFVVESPGDLTLTGLP
ncbi:MAG TPA: mucoidy inhibitor MuiA family protein [Ktedonobacterales bacterium]|nr:mucoidy inhibitor MuiA family protein [Ktedonobacterales bacterium]